jgi:hypothetical protein
MKKVLGIVSVCLIALIWLGWMRDVPEVRPAPSTTVQHSVSAPRVTPQDDKQRLDALQDLHQHLLEPFVLGDAEGEDLLRFHLEHSVYAQLVADGYLAPRLSSQTLQSPPKHFGAGARGYLVVVATNEDRHAFGHMTVSPHTFDPMENVLWLIPPDTLTPIWVSAALIHEIRHAYDINSGTTARDAVGHEWLMSEYRAYDIEFRLLDRATNGEWSKALDVIIDQIPNDARYDDAEIVPGGAAYRYVQERFTLASASDDAGICAGATQIGVNFRYADRRRLPIEWKLEFIKHVLNRE